MICIRSRTFSKTFSRRDLAHKASPCSTSDCSPSILLTEFHLQRPLVMAMFSERDGWRDYLDV